MIKTKPSKSKYALLAIALISLLAIAAPAQAHALTLIEWIASSVVAKIVYVVNYIIGAVVGIFFSIAAWLVGRAFDLNAVVLQSPIVALGWGVVRDVANLGFVLIIIIIAFATILRFENYGMKQTLWKLIVAAVLINFSFVIAGVFVDFSNVLTSYFQKEGAVGSLEMASKFADAFDVQKMLGVGKTEDETKYMSGGKEIDRGDYDNCETIRGEFGAGDTFVCQKTDERGNVTRVEGNVVEIKGKDKDDFEGAFGETFGKATIIAIASVIFNIVFTLLATLTMFAIAFMLLARYVALGILLIVMPFAWMAWVLPATSDLWGKWWSSFLRWTMFAPIMMFFLWLVFAVLDKLAATSGGIFSLQGAKDQASQAINQALAQSNPGEIIGQMIMLIGLLLGGLLAANQFSITGSKTFMGLAQGMGNWATGRARRAGLWGAHKIGGPKPTKEGEKSRTQRLSETGRGWKRGTQWLAAPVRGVGYALNRLGASYEKEIAGVPEELKGWSPERKNIEARRSSGARRAAILADLAKSGNINTEMHGLVSNESPEELENSSKGLEKLENDFKKLGLNVKDLTRNLGVDAETLRTIATGRRGDPEVARGAFEKLYRNWKPEDFAKTDFASYFKADAARGLRNLRAAIAYGIATAQPGATYKIYPNMKAAEVEEMNQVLKNEIETIQDPDKKTRAEEVIEKAFAKRFGGEVGPPTTATETS